MSMLRPLAYAGFLLSLFFVDRIVMSHYQSIIGIYRLLAEGWFDQESLFLGERFLKSVYRFVLSISTLAVFFLFAIFKIKSFSLRNFFKIDPFSAVLLILLFLHMNERSSNSSFISYAFLSYLSIIALMLREQVIFTTQIAFTTNSRWLGLLSLVGLGVFIFSHPLVFNLGRVTATLLIVNLWIYTVSVRNVWHGVAVHAIWNYAFPESAIFHFGILFYSFWLAFGQKEYPIFLSYPFENLSKYRIIKNLFCVWRGFWLLPARLLAGLPQWPA